MSTQPEPPIQKAVWAVLGTLDPPVKPPELTRDRFAARRCDPCDRHGNRPHWWVEDGDSSGEGLLYVADADIAAFVNLVRAMQRWRAKS